MELFEYIIVGSGFSGSVIAERIASVLDKKVLIIEQRSHPGGNCHDFKDAGGIIIHKYEPHFFHTNNKEVWDYLSMFTEWEPYMHRVLGFIDNKKVPLPFNFNAIRNIFAKSAAENFIKKLSENYPYNCRIPILELRKTNDKDLLFLSDYIYNNVFLNYTIKQWGFKPEEIDIEVTGRVPVLAGEDDRYFNDEYQGVPKGGYAELFQNILGHRKIKLLLNTDFKEVIEIDEVRGKIYFLNKEYKGKLIFTGMVDELFDYKFGALSYRSLNMELETVEKEYYQESAVVNYPNDFDFTRITEFKHIYSSVAGYGNRTVILKEYPLAYEKGKNLPLYPLLNIKSKEELSKYIMLAEGFKNLITAGRLAEYKYYDMDDAVESALKVFREKIINDK